MANIGSETIWRIPLKGNVRHGVGAFYNEHALILLCAGSRRALAAIRVTAIDEQVALGNGSERLLHCLLQEDVGFQVKADLK